MRANYHTHTYRCNHGYGDVPDYVRAAREAGLQTLGFSDHTPYPFKDGYYSNMRMWPRELPYYAASVRRAREENPDLTIHLGLEAEYYPAHFGQLMDMVRDEGVEYLILGQHWLGNEQGEDYNGHPTEDLQKLIRYCDQTIEAMQTGVFSYFAHPDLINFRGERKLYEQQIRRICQEAKSCNLPLELNLLGLKGGRNYPNPWFWPIAREEGCAVILGRDAHKPEALLDTDTEHKAIAFLAQWDLTPIEDLFLVKP